MNAIEEGLPNDEKEFVKQAHTGQNGPSSAAGVTAALYISHKMRDMADDMISSNKKLATASDDTAKALNRLTSRLVVVTVLLGVVGLTQVFMIWAVR